MPDGYLEDIIKSNRAVIIFDGLDELVETSKRQAIVDDIEAFVNLYPNIKVLVTSRQTGYDEAPLNKDRFSHYVLDGFSQPQVVEYISKWFSLEESPLTPAHENVETLQKELTAIPFELQANPLVLALICNIYQGEGTIPRNRPEIYRKCSEVLFERRDRERGITSTNPFQDHLFFATLAFLAHWIYGSTERENGVRERVLVRETAQFLRQKRYDDQNEAEAIARQFIEFCKGRAWVFTDTGTTKEGEALYQFTHRTFLEYFAAIHLTRTNPQPQDLFNVLRGDIETQQRIVVAEIAFQRLALVDYRCEGEG